MKWFFALLFLTSLFIISSFFISVDYVFAYRWMTIGMAIVSFIFYYIINKKNAKNAGGNLAAVVTKFMLSALVFVLYVAIFNPKTKIDFIFFVIAYVLYSLVSYTGAYYAIKQERMP